MKGFLRYAWKTVKWSFIVFLIFVASLYFREQRLPRALVGWIADRLSSESYVVRCDSATIGLRHGVTLSSVRVYDRRRQEMEAMVSAKSVSANHMTRRVKVVGLRYPRLPESYYSGECRERNERVEMELPSFPPFRLELEDADVLGVAASRLTAEVAVSPGSLRVDDIHGELSGGDRRRPVEGSFDLDIPSQRVHAEVGGQVVMSQVRPLLVALDIPSALRYFDAFTEMEAPVPATGSFVVNLSNGDFGMRLDLAPTLGKYNGVPLSKADGSLDLYVYTRGTNCNARFSVDLRSAEDERGRRLSGGILVDYTNDVTRLVFTDVKSGLRLRDALEIVDFIKPETLDVIECETPPEITVKGKCGTTAEDRGVNSMDFTAKVKHGSFLGLKLNDVLTEFSLRGDLLSFPVVSATGKTGGNFLASADVAIPEFDGDRAGFRLKVDYRRGSLEELADFFKFDLGERNGKVQGWCEFDGPVSSNLLSRLNGRGSVKVTDGHLAQMKLFAGLTAMLADKVPGVGFLVNQSQASTDFTVTNGLFRSDNVFIEGGLISIKGWGSYDIPRDNLDYTVRVQFLKNDSLLGKIVHPITWPFTKLLLEFRATGPIDSPKWEYISLLDRIL